MGSSRLSPFATPVATREVLERHGLFTKYGLGQNFLVDDNVIRRILELSEAEAPDHVLEVGPGIGTLTAALLGKGCRVTAVEMDYDLPQVLADTLSAWPESFHLLNMDALDLAEGDLLPSCPDGLPAKMVSNLPYAVAATVVLDYLQRFEFLESLTVMVQKEVADRMMAKPGTKEYGAYTVKLALHAKPSGRFAVSPGSFFPPPRVDSAVIRLDRAPVSDDVSAIGDEERVGLLRAACTMADAAFATRRKTLSNSCKAFFAQDAEVKEALPLLFEHAGIDPRRRGETLSLDEFLQLGRALQAAQAAQAMRVSNTPHASHPPTQPAS